MVCGVFFFFKQKTAYEMRISDWSSDVCSSDLRAADPGGLLAGPAPQHGRGVSHANEASLGRRRAPLSRAGAGLPLSAHRGHGGDGVQPVGALRIADRLRYRVVRKPAAE